ncbi:MAG TPA: hypothetical protein VE173_15855, partial [Longimicrobiales bacterium]|nr:hypothetical protein [Longimicrobiales bacterium]
MYRRTPLLLVPLLALLGCGQEATTPLEPSADLPTQLASAEKGGRAGALGEVYVRSQGLYYDTFVTVERLPMHGRFQKLEDGQTDYGPGDPGYLAGRWWVDVNGNDIQDEGDNFLL